MRARFLIPFGVVCLLMVFIGLGVHSVVAQGPDTQTTANYRLTKGQTQNGDLTVNANEVYFEAGSTVNGDVSVNALSVVEMHGTINGDLTVMASPLAKVNLEGLQVNGELTLCTRGQQTGLNTSNIGKLNNACDPATIFGGHTPVDPRSLPIVRTYSENPLLRLFQTILTAFLAAGLSAVAYLVFPGRMDRMIQTALRTPIETGIVGFLSLGTAVLGTGAYAVLTVLTVGILCIAAPLIGLGWLAVIAALIIGWIVISAPVGEWLLRKVHVDTTPMITAVFGAFALTLGVGLIQLIPCVGWIGFLITVILGSIGLGTVVLTRVGRRLYPVVVVAKPKTEFV